MAGWALAAGGGQALTRWRGGEQQTQPGSWTLGASGMGATQNEGTRERCSFLSPSGIYSQGLKFDRSPLVHPL